MAGQTPRGGGRQSFLSPQEANNAGPCRIQTHFGPVLVPCRGLLQGTRTGPHQGAENNLAAHPRHAPAQTRHHKAFVVRRLSGVGGFAVMSRLPRSALSLLESYHHRHGEGSPDADANWGFVPAAHRRGVLLDRRQ